MFLHLLSEKKNIFLSNCQIWFEAPSNQIHSHCRLDFDRRSNSRYFFHLFFSCNAQWKFKSLMCHNWVAIDKMFKDTSQIEYLILKTIFSFTYQIRFKFNFMHNFCVHLLLVSNEFPHVINLVNMNMKIKSICKEERNHYLWSNFV